MLSRRLLLAGAAARLPGLAGAQTPPPAAPGRAPAGAGRAARRPPTPAAPTGSPANTPIGPLDTAARWAVILDFNTGATLLDKDADVPMPPSSMTKLMTMYIVYEHAEVGPAAARPGTAGLRARLAHGRARRCSCRSARR